MPTFLDFPPEIRNLIYSLVLRSSTPIIAWAGMPLEEIAGQHKYDWCQDDNPQKFAMGPYFKNALPAERCIVNIVVLSALIG